MRGLITLSRGLITDYERGDLVNGSETFEAILHVVKQHEKSFIIETERTDAILGDSKVRAMGEEGVTEIGILCALAQACIQMRHAHEHAARELLWARGIGFGDQLEGDGSVKPAVKCFKSGYADSPAFTGWASVLKKARLEDRVKQPFHWPSLCEFMRLYFEGMEFCVQKQAELQVGAGLVFIVQNLRDPIDMIRHHACALHQTCGPLRMSVVRQAGLPSGQSQFVLTGNEDAYTELNAHRGVRQQLITMLRWVVALNNLVYRLESSVAKQIEADPTAIVNYICTGIPEIANSLTALIKAFCTKRSQSTFIDLHVESLKLWGGLNRSVYKAEHYTGRDEVGRYAFQCSQSLPFDYLKLFALTKERKPLADLVEMVSTLRGFPITDPRVEKDIGLILTCSHDGGFCAQSLQMLDLLRVIDTRSLKWEDFADAMLALTSAGGVDLNAALGINATGRQARRRAEIQKIARRHHLLVTQTLTARFTSAEIEDFCARRKRSYDALLAIIHRIMPSLREVLTKT